MQLTWTLCSSTHVGYGRLLVRGRVLCVIHFRASNPKRPVALLFLDMVGGRFWTSQSRFRIPLEHISVFTYVPTLVTKEDKLVRREDWLVHDFRAVL